MQKAKCFLEFDSEVSQIALPEKFTFPFYYEPHELSLRAAQEIQEFILKQEWNKDFGMDKSDAVGIMFGVLVVRTHDGRLGYLAGFSGKLAGSNHREPFVPPVFDILTEDGFFRQEEKKIEELTEKIERLENASELRELRDGFQSMFAQSEVELGAARKTIKEGKRDRKRQRDEAKPNLSSEAYSQLEAVLVKQSLDDQYKFKRLAKKWKHELSEARTKLDVLQGEIEILKNERKSLSGDTQARLFDHYQFLNGNGDSKSLLSIFETTPFKTPPAGAGECAAPKLLHYAYLKDMKPIAMAEFWWGRSPNSEIRKHKQYYPSCRSKCEPILGHMLIGLDVEPNELLDNLNDEKDLEIIFEDDHMLAVNKPAEFLSVPGKEIEDSVFTRIKKKYPDADGPMVVHRLDMSTSGIMLVAKNKDIHKALQHQFENRTVKKRYVALLDGELQGKRGEINLPLRVDFHDRPRQLVCHEHGKTARTIWELVKVEEGRSRVRFYPITGRTHQLRVHAAHAEGLNTPIHGDDLYGKKADRLHLHAEQIRFVHPVTQKELTLKVPAPF